VTVNKPFAEPFARLASGDKVALLPTQPTPPPPEQVKPRRDDG
jgi:hypothetical protein